MSHLRPILIPLLLVLTVLSVGGEASASAGSCVTIPDCLAQLRFGETRGSRELAAQRLGERGSTEAIPYLARSLAEDEHMLRMPPIGCAYCPPP